MIYFFLIQEVENKVNKLYNNGLYIFIIGKHWEKSFNKCNL